MKGPVIINKTGHALDSAVEVSRRDGDSESFTYPQLPNETPVELPERSGWTLTLQGHGFLIEPGRCKKVTLEAGQQYEVVLDLRMLPLSPEDLKKMGPLIAQALGRGGHPPRGVDLPLWPWLCEQLGRPSHVADKLGEMVHRILASYPKPFAWHDLYITTSPYPSPTPIDRSKLVELLREGRATATVYYRSLDRYPGDNADMNVVKLTLPGDGTPIVADRHLNWDGAHYRTTSPVALGGEFFPPTIASEFFQRVAGVVDSGPLSQTSVRYDVDEYDDENHMSPLWSSQEIFVHDLDGQLLFHLHERWPISEGEYQLPIEEGVEVYGEYDDSGEPRPVHTNSPPAIRALFEWLAVSLNLTVALGGARDLFDHARDPAQADAVSQELVGLSDLYLMPVFLSSIE